MATVEPYSGSPGGRARPLRLSGESRWMTGRGEVSHVLPQLRIDELLDELQTRLGAVRSSRDRVRHLLKAVVAIGSGLDLESALTRIVQAAVTLVDARYGALGVLGDGQRLARFITVGLGADEIKAIGLYPEVHGLLGELIRHPVPLRTEDLNTHPRSYCFPANHPPMRSFLGVPIRVREEVFGNLYMTEKRGGMPFDADDEAAADHVVAVLREALSNVARHAHATKVEVAVSVDGANVTLAVVDDGVGIPEERGRRSGPANLEERAQQLGGSFSMHPGADGGTVLVWSAPADAGED